MIPRRISLRGFLCYREEQDLDFAGATLWMLGGPNGSGKSAIFDAVTYALFGHHRGGSQHAAELINKDADGLQVEFDFSLDDELYRVRRTLRKSNRGSTSATQGVYRHQSSTNGGAGKWEPVPDTNRKTEFDAWVRDRLGLTYETFTSSVLLLQGRAEKLLDSTAKGRFEVLAGIVDLERYARLHAKADERRRTLKAKAEALQHQLAALPAVADGELAAIDEKIAAAEASRLEAVAELERWQAAEFHAKQWAELQAKSAALTARWRQAEALLAEADAIDCGADRWRELNAVLPHLESAIRLRGQFAESQRISESLTTNRQAAQERLAACDSALGQAQKKRAALQKSIATDEQRHADIAARLRRLEGVCARLNQLERQRLELGRREAELARLPADIETMLMSARATHDELSQLSAVVPLLARFVQARDDLRSARNRERLAAEQEQSTKARGELLAAEVATLTPQVEARAAERRLADDAVSAAKALRQQAADQERAFRELKGARLCSQCGQELTAEHFGLELAKRQAEVADADTKVTATLAAQQPAQQAETNIRQHASQLEKELLEKREAYRDLRRQLEQARAEAERHVRDCAAVYRDLPEPFRQKISAVPPADWLATIEPTAADVDAARAKVTGLDAARARLREIERQHISWTALQGQIQTLRQTVEAQSAELPGEPEELRRTFARTESEEKAVAGSLKAARTEARIVQEELDRLTAERQTIEGELSATSARLQAEEATRKHSRQGLDTAQSLLPENWRAQAEQSRLSELHTWKTERDALGERGIEQKSRELQQARAGFEALRQSKAELDRELELFPVEARRPIAEVQGLLQDARRRSGGCEETVRAARHEKALLDDRHARRAELHATTLEVDRDHNRFGLLAELLSRERLQLHLVRQAERQIVDHANAVLDRLSGGQLYLRLRSGEAGQDSDRALELESLNRTTGGAAINVSFLSGSQRFRVAVSLALAIGQYASRRHRPIESVIIDEGFGCLDRNGRQVMIQELQNLRGHLRCILLVSHQEEFADAFADGYRFELVDGTTRVTRIQK